MRNAHILLVLLAPLAMMRAGDPAPHKFILGALAIGDRYHSTADAPMLEIAKLIAAPFAAGEVAENILRSKLPMPH